MIFSFNSLLVPNASNAACEYITLYVAKVAILKLFRTDKNGRKLMLNIAALLAYRTDGVRRVTSSERSMAFKSLLYTVAGMWPGVVSIRKEQTNTPSVNAPRIISVLKSRENTLSAFAVEHTARKQRTTAALFQKLLYICGGRGDVMAIDQQQTILLAAERSMLSANINLVQWLSKANFNTSDNGRVKFFSEKSKEIYKKFTNRAFITAAAADRLKMKG